MAPSVRSPLVGAYYSDWFPSNSAQGTLRQHLVPGQGADPTLVHSDSPAVAATAIAQASRSGINFFAMDYWPSRPAQNENIDAFLRAKNVGDIKFCLLYETWDLGFDAAHEATSVTPTLEAKFDADLVQFARTYFTNPRYLRIDGRPVLVLYLSRTLTGDVAGMLQQARALLQRHGFNPYLIGDEVFWRTTAIAPPPAGSWLTGTPQTARIDLFDAITAYELYVGDVGDPMAPWQDFVGYPGTTGVVGDELRLYRWYAAASGGTVPVIPDVMPGTNDRGVRLQENHSAEPRQWLAGQSPGSTLSHFLDQVARPTLNARLPVVFVTSWNEWNEDTAVEPVGGTPTAHDDSLSGTAYTQGYTYGGEGGADLTAIRNFVAVAWGRVVTAAGVGRRGVMVVARRHGQVVSRARTDSGGWYVLPRTAGTGAGTGTGTLDVSLASGSGTRTVRVSTSTARWVKVFG
jgi:glycoprotein endo-alpha-1,2-mannosidase